MLSDDLVDVIAAAGVQRDFIYALDQEYALPKEEWVFGTFAGAWVKLLSQLKLETGTPRAWDCDKFSRLAWSFAAICWERTPARTQVGLAFGWLYYMTERGTCHSINCFVTRQAGEAKLVFVEPQEDLVNGQILALRPRDLTPDERSAVRLLLI